EKERDQDDGAAHQRRVLEPAEVVGVAEDEVDVRRGGVIEPEREPMVVLKLELLPERRRRRVVRERDVVEVVEVAFRLEGGHEHPVEREREHDRERADDQVGDAAFPERRPHAYETSTFRAKRSINTVTTSSTGSR